MFHQRISAVLANHLQIDRRFIKTTRNGYNYSIPVFPIKQSNNYENLITSLKNNEEYFNYSILSSHVHLTLKVPLLNYLYKMSLNYNYLNNEQIIGVDFSSPNIAKTLGFHHIRSIVIGNWLSNVNKHIGNTVYNLNFLGNYGEGINMILCALDKYTIEEVEKMELQDIHNEYTNIRKIMKNKDNLTSEQEQIQKRIQEIANDDLDHNTELGQKYVQLVKKTTSKLEEIYDFFNIKFDSYYGEREAANNKQILNLILDQLVEFDEFTCENSKIFMDLSNHGIRERFYLLNEHKNTNYGTRDLITLYERFNNNLLPQNLNKCYYVVDESQSLHFKKVFMTFKMMYPNSNPEHVGFGLVTMYDKETKTYTKGSSRLGNTYSLLDTITELTKVVKDKSPNGYPKELLDKLVNAILVIEVLRIKKNSPIKFNIDKMTDIRGHNGLYIMYSFVRLVSALNKSDTLNKEGKMSDEITDANMLKLYWLLTYKHHYIEESLSKMESSILIDYLFELVKEWTTIFIKGKHKDSHQFRLVNNPNNIYLSGMIFLGNTLLKTFKEIFKIIGVQYVEYM